MIIGMEVGSEHFTYSRASNVFSEELSNLKPFAIFGRLYDDACDQGFVLVSQRTGKKVAVYRDWILEGEDPNNAEENMTFYFRPVDTKNKFTVVVFND